MGEDKVVIDKVKFWAAYELYKNLNRDIDSNIPDFISHESFDKELGIEYHEDMNDIYESFYFFKIINEKKLFLSKIKYGF